MLIPEFQCGEGQTIALTGPSGCGKSTFLNLIAGILTPSSGSILIDATEISALSQASAAQFRISNIGLIFQEFELIEHLSVSDNILLPVYLGAGQNGTSIEQRARDFARDLGIAQYWDALPGILSHGERQRAAICRALSLRPRILLADEPTGNLDPANKQKTLQMMQSIAKEQGQALLVATHDLDLVGSFDAVIHFEDLNHASQV